MDYNEMVTFVQGHFSDGLALVIGAGLSAAEGIGMPELAAYLDRRSDTLHEGKLEGKPVLVFEVDWSMEVHQLTDGRYLLRVDDETHPG